MVARGQVWTVSLDPTTKNEQRGTRLCLVVSADRYNSLPIRQAIIVPLTSRERGFPHHIQVADDGGLNRPSSAMSEGVRAVSVERFGRLISTASRDTMNSIAQQLILWLSPHDD